MDIIDIAIAKKLVGGDSGGGGGSEDSDFSTAEVVITNNSDNGYINIAFIIDAEPYVGTWINTRPGRSGRYNVVLFKGCARGEIAGYSTVNVSGDIEFSEGSLVITGDGTITLE